MQVVGRVCECRTHA